MLKLSRHDRGLVFRSLPTIRSFAFAFASLSQAITVHQIDEGV